MPKTHTNTHSLSFPVCPSACLPVSRTVCLFACCLLLFTTVIFGSLYYVWRGRGGNAFHSCTTRWQSMDENPVKCDLIPYLSNYTLARNMPFGCRGFQMNGFPSSPVPSLCCSGQLPSITVTGGPPCRAMPRRAARLRSSPNLPDPPQRLHTGGNTGGCVSLTFVLCQGSVSAAERVG